MKLQDISQPTTSSLLNENLAKTFGQKINLEEFDLEQLYDARNKIRTQLRSIETMESFDATNNDKYQRNKMLHDVLNMAIAERQDVEVDEAGTRSAPGFAGHLGGNEVDFKKIIPFLKNLAGDVQKGAINTKDDLVKAFNNGLLQAKGNARMAAQNRTVKQQTVNKMPTTPRVKPNTIDATGTESIVYTKGSKLREGAQEQAELVMASKELADTVGKWLQDTAEMQSESMLKLTDAIRDELGQEQADSFQNAVKPTLEALYQALEASRTALTQGVSLLTGEGAPADAMGAEAPAEGGEMAAEPEMEPVEGGEEMGAEMGDEFAGAEAAGGGTAPEGREQRESRIPLSHQLGTILSSKKK